MVEILKNTYLKNESIVNYLFNQQAYIVSKQPTDFYLFQSGNAFCYLFQSKNEYRNPLKATFGGVEFTSVAGLTELLIEIKRHTTENNISSVKIGMSPQYLYDEKAREVFQEQGFTASLVDQNFHIDITEKPFKELLHRSERKRLRKCIENGFTFSLCETPQLEKVYQFIKNCRDRKNYSLNISLEDFKSGFQLFPEKYKVFQVKDEQQNVASLGVMVDIAPQVLYHFHLADHEDYLQYSPSVLLYQGLYEYCQNNHYQTLDLGIATDQGVANENLIRFKKNIGGEQSEKITYEFKA